MTMRVHIGTRNLAKVQALTEELEAQNIPAKLISIDVDSGVKAQPRCLKESYAGAINRAKSACNDDATFSVGIEDGCYHIEGKLLNISCVCLWDGSETFFASSSSFQLPHEVQKVIENEHLELSQALVKTGFTSNPDIGSLGGAIGLITQGQLIRKTYTRQALLNLFSSWKLQNDLS
ncbi:inosine/xanthosine triphosphatase [Lentisphaera profundi]|uniref:inosine/xanthosine triphosphatase n=1 Tax=Lentisphaera profundi TaxID=1658616 RepID=A0ABY7VT41_9BACT|nr:inosine/xanthosine triphosphatase [Lentisphaera profundi]WDE97385.1 inosine/xanthosine triphosphatase [Lentisphaera profundi]